MLGALELKAGAAYQRAFRASEEGEQAPAAPASRVADTSDAQAYLSMMQNSGRRLGWCRSFDRLQGCGVLVDLDQKTEYTVTSWSLKVDSALVAPNARVLHPGEFVEYEPSAAQELADGGSPADGWVCGILGWPLMCEALAKNGGAQEEMAIM